MIDGWQTKRDSDAYFDALCREQWERIDGLAPKRRRMSVHSLAWANIRLNVFKRDNFTCSYCGSKKARLECDHIIPVALGGGEEMSNLTTACKPCNRSKGAKSLAEWRS